MVRSSLFFVLTACALSACNSYMQPRPFAGRGGQSLDQPPRYGDGNRYVEPIASAQQTSPSVVVPPVPEVPAQTTTIPGMPGVDQGLTLTPTPNKPAITSVPTTPPISVTSPSVPTTPKVTTPTPTPVASDVPFARSVAGQPGFVYSPKDPNKKINVDGLRPGSKAKDPETGEIFRVPFQ